MKNYQEFFLDLPYKTIAGITWGPDNGKPIVAIHGWLDNAASFIPLIPYLNKYKVYAIDLVGHGHSSHIHAGNYLHFIDYIPDIIFILRHLGLQNCTLLGHSLGAGIATMVSGTIPTRVDSLILLDGIGAKTIADKSLPQQLSESIEEYLKLNAKRTTVYPTIEQAVKVRLQATPMQEEAAQLLVERGTKTIKDGFTWRTDPRLLCTPLVLPTEEQLLSFIKNITAKTCLIKPNAGFPYNEETFLNRISHLQNVTTHEIAGNHHVHMDEPEIVGALIQDFLQHNNNN